MLEGASSYLIFSVWIWILIFRVQGLISESSVSLAEEDTCLTVSCADDQMKKLWCVWSGCDSDPDVLLSSRWGWRASSRSTSAWRSIRSPRSRSGWLFDVFTERCRSACSPPVITNEQTLMFQVLQRGREHWCLNTFFLCQDRSES